MDRVHTKKTPFMKEEIVSSGFHQNWKGILLKSLCRASYWTHDWFGGSICRSWGPLASLTYKLSTGEHWEVNSTTENYPRDMRRVVHTTPKHAQEEVLGCVTIHAVQVNESPSVRMAYIQPGQCQVLLWSESLLLLESNTGKPIYS